MSPPKPRETSGERVAQDRVENFAYSLYDHYYADDVQDLAADLLDSRARVAELQRTIELGYVEPGKIDERWQLALHVDGCPFDELKSWRFDHGLETEDSVPCTCTEAHKLQSWACRAFVLGGTVRMQANKVAELERVVEAARAMRDEQPLPVCKGDCSHGLCYAIRAFDAATGRDDDKA